MGRSLPKVELGAGKVAPKMVIHRQVLNGRSGAGFRRSAFGEDLAETAISFQLFPVVQIQRPGPIGKNQSFWRAGNAIARVPRAKS
jgi:hypothetical protein